MKKFLSCILVVCMLFTCIPLAFAAEPTVIDSGFCGTNAAYTLYSDGVLNITGTGNMKDYGTGETPWYSYRSDVKTVIIADGITSVGHTAFQNCSALTLITIPSSVTSIGDFAIVDCDALTSIIVDEGNTVYCSENNCLIEKATHTLVAGCKSSIIPSTVTSIGDRAFEGRSALMSVNIPSSVTSIGSSAFKDCESLTSVTIPSTVTSIGSNAFYNTGLFDVYYYGTREQWNALKNTPSLVNIPSASKVFYEVGTEYTLADGVLYNKNDVLLVDYPNGKQDRYYVVHDGVRSIAANAFSDCQNVYSVFLPEGLKDIGANAFDRSAIKSIYIPASITTIESRAFSDSKLTDIYFGGTQAEWNAVSKSDAGISSSVTVHYEDKLTTKDGSVYNADGTQLVLYAGENESFTVNNEVISVNKGAFINDKNIKTVILNNTVTKIDDNTFENCTALESIAVPSSVTSIGNYAFSNCAMLNTITLPGVTSAGSHDDPDGTAIGTVTFSEHLTSIGQYAFSGCSALTAVDIPDSVNSMGTYAFNNCISLKTAKFTVGMTTIPAYTFNGCIDLRTIYIPAEVKACGNYAFEGDTVLNDVYFGGSNVQWDLFNIGNGNNVLYGANIHYAHIHEFGEWVTVAEVTAYTDGLETRTCATCGYTEKNIIPCGHEHSYTPEDIIPASCYDHIIRRFTCACGRSYEVELGLKGHNISYVAAKPSTCLENGNISCFCCADCGEYFTNAAASVKLPDSARILPLGEHKWEYDHTEADSCTEPGTAYYYCSVCKTEHTEAVTVGHSFTETTVEAGCLSRGYTLHVCNKCKYSYTDAYTPALGHMDVNSDKLCDICGEPLGGTSGGCSHDFEFTYTPATCTENGLIKLTCKNCPKVSEESIPALNHNYVDFVIEPTCTANGYTKHYCINCGNELVDTFVSASGHTMRAMTIKPTCTENGCDIEICDNCGYNYEENIVMARGHEMAVKVNAPATCLTAGKTVYECAVCKTTETETANALGHDIVKHKAKAATCTEPGWAAYETCTRCDYTTFEAIPASGHTYTVINAKEASATEPGYTGDTVCTGCGNVISTGAGIPAGSTLKPSDYPDFGSGKFEHRNNGNNWDFWYENKTFVDGTQFIVGEVTSGEDFNACGDKNKNRKFKMFDLKAQNGEMLVQPDGVIWIALNLPGKYDPDHTLIYYVNGDTYEKMPCFVKDGKIYFSTTHFSCFAVVDNTCVHTYALTDYKEVTCTTDGVKTFTCSGCGTTYTETVKATGHADANADGFCDVCGTDMSTPLVKCSHLCHKTGFLSFIWKIVNLFNKLFKINQFCECGAAHW